MTQSTSSARQVHVDQREAVLAMLGAAFAGIPDREELYQEAWAELLGMRARGQQSRNVSLALGHYRVAPGS